jgi:hypothetical protein
LAAHPALAPGALGDLVLDALDRDRVRVDAEDAGRLAGCRAEPSREFGEVVGGVEPLDGGRPVVAIDEVVPLRDEVPERAALVAERDAAVHAASALVAGRLVVERLVDLAPVPQAHRYGAPARQFAAELDEPGRLTHGPTP